MDLATMIVLSKSNRHLSRIEKETFQYFYFIKWLFLLIAIGVSNSNASFLQKFSTRNFQQPSLYNTASIERRDNFNVHLEKDVDSLGKEIANQRATYDKQNVSYNLCKKMHDIKCHESVFRRNLQVTRQKASALHKLRRRLFTLGPANSEVAKKKPIKQSVKSSSKPRTRRRSKLNRNKRAATANESLLWEHATIPYVFDTVFSGEDKLKIMLAMSMWENATCVIFKEREASDKDYFVLTVKDCGCCADVGRKENGSSVSLAKDCMITGIILHELGHIIGFWHEHSRPDRDEYVDVFLKHAIKDKVENFKKKEPNEINSLNETYDFDSIMHYGRTKWTRNPYWDTIFPKLLNGSALRPDIGQRSKLSPGDIRQTNKLYKCASCGRTFQEETATFSHKPTAGKSETCHWRIRAAYGERIVLNITALGIPRSANCVNGHVEVRDGPNSQSPQIGRFCGEDLPGPLKSSGRRMWLEYKTLRGDGSGFTARYVTECGGEISSGEGVLASPTYNDKYLPNLDCSWTIKVDPGYLIILSFESFDLEDDLNCAFDYLEIMEGSKETDPLIGKYCGLSYPKKIQSTGNQLFIRFVSDSDTQRNGFYIPFVKEIDECNNEIHECDQVCINTIGGYRCECILGYELKPDRTSCEKACGGVIETPNGTISSPFFPDPYPPDKTCEWIIDAPQNHTIVLTFTHFDLEAGQGDCSYDFVKVYPEGGARKYNNVMHCGDSIPTPITAKGNTMKIEFKSDKYDEKSGFSAFFVSDVNECENKNGGCQDICTNTVGSYYCSCRNGYILQSDQRGCVEECFSQISEHNGTITSPDFPEEYPRNTECDWLLIAPLGHRIRLAFQSLSLEHHQSCNYDSLTIFDGDNRNASLIDRYCGSIFPELVISRSNNMLVSFTSDSSVQKKGFEARHDTVCGSFLEATYTPQTIVSHVNYGILNYDTWEYCDWVINASLGFKVELNFQTFYLEYQKDCEYDYVIVYDGVNDSGPVLGTFCGNKLPGRIISESPSLLVRFTTDNTINKKGFTLQFIKVENALK
ncbi:unnamed protein product [Lymnaea stagnalis]|uniref:Metalloendopeptidase n=1 Tax=Lymnaea stagnalis TaxID=6523 RepID=A0AAV2HSD8_LYMST